MSQMMVSVAVELDIGVVTMSSQRVSVAKRGPPIPRSEVVVVVVAAVVVELQVALAV